MPTTWEYGGQVYATVEEAANAAASHSIPEDIRDWMEDRHERTVRQLKGIIKKNMTLEVEVASLKNQITGMHTLV
ncbi:uncharacterized protein LAESUDRAFT_760481 [Laetiporus sulphureus 93-53]|uniref:Uncharacterized protein n=1 Tax=Laetiporus sulphureus 93-53 TaxID=1314785 RepID=A0A165DP56_9APHY|nr:uncharacterized protein LAESUDRAFT_760481 [Laetiporus sulphureus 93-53]KZT05316.1 hypothetical protein LAESUDRAFT_760481 [Laetiporus sulphureus 93-53]